MLVSEANSEQALFKLRRELRDAEVVATFTVYGEPVSKARARVVHREGRKPTSFTPAKTRTAEEAVGWAFQEAAPRWKVDGDQEFGVMALFFSGTRQRRDVDNMLKLILDGLNGVAWVDDDQVTEVAGRKGYCDAVDARTEVLIYISPIRVREPGEDRVCPNCGQTFRVRYQSQSQTYCTRACSQVARAAEPRFCKATDCGNRTPRDHAYCSPECKQRSCTIERTCEVCGDTFTRYRSWVSNGRAFCSDLCRRTYWNTRKKKAGQGICADCGGPTSKKSYTRCAACAAVAQRKSS